MTFASDKLGNLIHCLRFIVCGCFLCQVCHIIHVLPIISSRSTLHLFVCRPVLLLLPLGFQIYDFPFSVYLLACWPPHWSYSAHESIQLVLFSLRSMSTPVPRPILAKCTSTCVKLSVHGKSWPLTLIFAEEGDVHTHQWLLFSSSCQAFLIAESAKPVGLLLKVLFQLSWATFRWPMKQDTKLHLKRLGIYNFIRLFWVSL